MQVTICQSLDLEEQLSSLINNVTRLGDLLVFGQLFNAFGNN